MKLKEVINHGLKDKEVPSNEANTRLIKLDNTLTQRIKGLKSWLDSNGQGYEEEKEHLKGGSMAQVYWNSGYYEALNRVQNMINNGSNLP